MRALVGDALPLDRPVAPSQAASGAEPGAPGDERPAEPPARKPAEAASVPAAESGEPSATPSVESSEPPRSAEAPAGVVAHERPTPEPAAPAREPQETTAARPTAAGPSAGAAGEPQARPAAPHVLIVGGGATGAALAYDLVLRGLRVTVLEKAELTSGATGRGQGLLHSGARYATVNRRLAVECVAENKILRRIAPGTFEENDGLCVALTDEDADFAPRFLEACWQAAVPTRRLTREEALRSEPGLNPQLRLAVQVADATMDSMRLALRFFASARSNGADVRHFAEVVAIDRRGDTVTGVRVRDRATDSEYQLGADLVINAAGPWASHVAGLAGVRLATANVAGLMVSFRGRHTNTVVSRLHAPGDADTLVPDRRSTVAGALRSTNGATNGATDTASVERLRGLAAELVPALATAPLRARWVAEQSVRPDDGAAEVGEPLFVDHGHGPHPAHGFATLIGGPTTTMRSTAQTAADAICRRFGIERECETADLTLLPHTAWYA